MTWGSYELVVESVAGSLPASYRFEAGWYVAPQALETPEALKVSLDKPRYAIGETATVHLETRFDGIALVMVVDDRLVTTETVEVTGTTADVQLEVTRDWGPGAYVTAVLYRPMDIEARRMPARAIGLAWAGVDPGERDLNVVLTAPDETRPRQRMDVEIELAGLTPGEEAYVTLAAVDVGILNLTGYETPDPEAYYFGQRRLGMSIRDVYNELIDRMQGVRGTVRSGGDAASARMQGPTPTEALIAFHSGIVEVGEDGTAHVSVPLPDFNGTVRLMALAWTREGVGHAEAGRAGPRSGRGDGEPAELPRAGRPVAAAARRHRRRRDRRHGRALGRLDRRCRQRRSVLCQLLARARDGRAAAAPHPDPRRGGRRRRPHRGDDASRRRGAGQEL